MIILAVTGVMSVHQGRGGHIEEIERGGNVVSSSSAGYLTAVCGDVEYFCELGGKVDGIGQ